MLPGHQILLSAERSALSTTSPGRALQLCAKLTLEREELVAGCISGLVSVQAEGVLDRLQRILCSALQA